MTQSITRGHLEGIVQGACRRLGLPPTTFELKPGAELFRGNAEEYYVDLQNVPGSINTQEAVKKRLIRRLFAIKCDARRGHEPLLRILEWSAQKDAGKSGYRVLWEKELNVIGARMEMMERFITSHGELVKQ